MKSLRVSIVNRSPASVEGKRRFLAIHWAGGKGSYQWKMLHDSVATGFDIQADETADFKTY